MDVLFNDAFRVFTMFVLDIARSFAQYRTDRVNRTPLQTNRKSCELVELSRALLPLTMPCNNHDSDRCSWPPWPLDP